MSRAKLFNMIKSRGEQKVGRNPFDLSNSHAYTSKAGKITPIKALHTVPYDYFEVNLAEFSQNNIPLNTAAFLKGKKELLAYFVPYNTIWHNYNQYQATREDPDSAILYQRGISYEPRIKVFTLYNSALYFALLAWVYKEYPRIGALYSCWLAHYGFTSSSDTTEYTLSEYLDKMQDLTDVYAYYDNATRYDEGVRFTRQSLDAMDFSAETPWFSDVTFNCFEASSGESLKAFDTVRDFNGNFVWCDWLQKLDMLGYGNLYPVIKTMLDGMSQEIDKLFDDDSVKITYSKFGKDASSDSSHDSTIDRYILDFQNFTSSIGEYTMYHNWVVSCINRIMSMTTYYDDSNTLQYRFLNPYAIFAYNKCFYDYMRNVYFDNNYSVFNYNCDYIDGSSLAGSEITQQYLPLRWYRLECHQWKKDFFTGVLPDNQLGQVSELILNNSPLSITGQPAVGTLAVGGPNYGNIGSDGENASKAYYRDADGNTILNDQDWADIFAGYGNVNLEDVDNHLGQIRTPHYHNISGSPSKGTLALSDPNITLNVLALKRAEAIQQYRQDLMRAGNRTKDVFKQIYGVEPKSELDECPYFIEVASNDININPIVSTASTGSENNGKLGDIAARALINPEKSLHFKFSTKDFGCIIFMSYIVPESMYNSYRIDPMNTHLDQESHGLPYFQNLGLQPIFGEYLSNLGNADVQNRILGYAPPYLEFKTDIDLVHGNLVDCYLPALSENDLDTEYQGSMSHWVVARTDMQQEQTVSLRNFYINPRVLDNVFQFNAGDDYETDHFLNFCQISVQGTRAFSEIGLPRF